jgi:hypothetical protein
VVHATVVHDHLEEWALAGAFFVVLAAAELAVGVAALASRRASRVARALAGTAVLLGVGPLLVWTVSRTAGLPFGPEAGEPEGIGVPDLAAGLLEMVTVAVGVVLLTRPERGRQRAPRAVHGSRMLLVGALAVTLLGVTSALPDLLGDVTGPANEVTTSFSGHAHGDESEEAPDADGADEGDLPGGDDTVDGTADDADSTGGEVVG